MDYAPFSEGLKNNYHKELIDLRQISKKAFLINTNDEYCFMKNCDKELDKKYKFLYNVGVSNILFPYQNNSFNYVSLYNDQYFFISPYYKNNNDLLQEVKAQYLFDNLITLHNTTSFKRQLSVKNSRKKIDEITKQLNYKFSLIENFIRSIETKPLDHYSMPILSNYQYILNAKFELVKLEKSIIQSIKEEVSVDFVFVHNNPKLDHLLIDHGHCYLTSIDRSKIGLPALDIAKFYIENEDLNIDFVYLLKEYFKIHDEKIYYDYFRFLVLFIYIKQIDLNGFNNETVNTFVSLATSIKTFMIRFNDNTIKE